MKVILGLVVIVAVLLGSFIVVFDRIAAHKKEAVLKQEEAQKKVEEEQIRQAELRKLEIQKEAERARLLAKQEAERVKLQAVKEKQLEEERIRTHPQRLMAAQKELADANSVYFPLVEQVSELKKKVGITQAQLESLDEKANGLERQENNSRTHRVTATERKNSQSQERYSNTQSSSSKSSSRSIGIEEGDKVNRGMTSKASNARAEADRKRVALNLLEDQLIEAQNKLAEAEANYISPEF